MSKYDDEDFETEIISEADLEEVRAEAYLDDSYDRIREENSILLMESVQDLIINLGKLTYYKGRKEGLAKDLITNILRETEMKISVDDVTPSFQNILLEKKENCCLNNNDTQ